MIRRSKAKWQKSFIKEVFNCKNGEKFSNIILKNLDLLTIKNNVLPRSLYKFYAPTSDNILDVKYKRIWMSHPNNFNDPFDCRIGYDQLAYEKNRLLEYFKIDDGVEDKASANSFTQEDKERISRSILRYPRGLVKFIVDEGGKSPIYTNLADEILTVNEGKEMYQAYDFDDYKLKVNRRIEAETACRDRQSD